MSGPIADRTPIPPRVILSGIGYRVQVSEGLIVFAEDGGVFGCRCRMSFERRASIWYLTLTGTHGTAPVPHIVKAYEFVKAAYGGSFEQRNGENEP